MIAHLRVRDAMFCLASLAVLATLAGCGSALKPESAADADPDAPSVCQQTVMKTLTAVLVRIYDEGVESERTKSAEHLIAESTALRTAVEEHDSSAARAAAKALLATGHMTNLQVSAGGSLLTSVGGPALTPLHGTVENAAGATIAGYVASVWADSGFDSEASGIAEGLISLRVGEHSIGGSIHLPDGKLKKEGTIVHDGVEYAYTSFEGALYPSGKVRIYVLKPFTEIAKLCAATPDETVANTLGRVANLIYAAEAGPRTLVQVHRVQQNMPLLEAVAAHDAPSTSEAVAALLHHHLVRLRVISDGQVLDDDGGPYVLAPVRAKLKLHGKKIGSIVLSIQDDEGYLRLTHRLAGLDVLMYMSPLPGSKTPRLVKNSLGPGVGSFSSVPASGPYTYKGKHFRVLTVHATEFPAGPLTIRVLIPIPYS